MVINNENKRDISMYKQANPTPTVDPNDANNPLPAALMLGAIGGVAGLGGSLLSKKQRKHKLRNTLLGATALPAAFLAANKWGPEAIKGKLNDFSGNVYKGYEDYIKDRLPKSMADYIGSQSTNSQAGVAAQINNLEEKQKEKVQHANTPKKDIQKDIQSMPKPTGMSYSQYTDKRQQLTSGLEDKSEWGKAQSEADAANKQLAEDREKAETAFTTSKGNIKSETTDLNTRQKQLNEQLSRLNENAQLEASTAQEAYDAARKAIKEPADTEAWKRLEEEMGRLTSEKQQAVIDRLRAEVDSLQGQAKYDALDALDAIDNADTNELGAKYNLEAAQNKVTTFGKELEDLRTKYTEKNKSLEETIKKLKDEEQGLKGKIYNSKTSPEYQAARKDYDTSEIDALENTLKLYDPKKSDLTGAFVQKLVDEGDEDASKALAALTPLEKEFSEKFSQSALSQSQAAALEAARKRAEQTALLEYGNEKRDWQRKPGNSGKATPPADEVTPVSDRIDAIMRQQREQILAEAEKEFEKKKQQHILDNLAGPRDKMRGVINRAVALKRKRLGELNGALDTQMSEDQKKMRARLPQLGGQALALQKELTARKSNNFADVVRMAKLQKAVEAANKEVALYTKQQEGFKNPIEYSPIVQNLLDQYGKEYDEEKIQPVRQQMQDLIDKHKFNVSSLDESNELMRQARDSRYAEERSDLENQLTSIVNRLAALREEQKNLESQNTQSIQGFDERDRAIKQKLIDAETQERQRAKEIESAIGKLDEQWTKDQKDYNDAVNKWHTQYGEDLQYNQNWDEKLNQLESNEAKAQDLLNFLREGESIKRNLRERNALAATGGGAGLIVLLSALNKLRKRKKQEISPEEYLNYLEEEGMA